MTTAPADIQSLLPDLPNGGCPLAGVATAGMPRAEHFARLVAAGYRTVLDICAPEEARGFDEPAAVAAAGMEYINLPVRSSTPDDSVFDAARSILRDPDRRPLFFHCRSANRVGGLLLPHLVLDLGMSEEQALREAGRVGLRNPDLAHVALAYIGRQRAAEVVR